MSEASTTTIGSVRTGRPRLGFLGAGPGSRHRLQALQASGAAEVAVVADAAPAALAELPVIAPQAVRVATLDALLAEPLDGVVIATSSAQHAAQAQRVLAAGLPVFCEQPLGRTAAETRGVIEAARAANVLLAVDLSYRFTEAMRVLRSIVQAGELGDVFAVDLVYHRARAPERAWAREPQQAAGGCVSDVGIHLLDLALWTLGFPRVTGVASRRYAQGEALSAGDARAEDYAAAQLELDTGATLRLACSWNLASGRDAVIEASFYGTEGGGSFHNVGGSTHDFTAELYRGTSRHTLAAPPDEWAGRALLDWTTRLAAGARYDPWVEGITDVAAALDAVLGRS